jgi:hypothetical protein
MVAGRKCDAQAPNRVLAVYPITFDVITTLNIGVGNLRHHSLEITSGVQS